MELNDAKSAFTFDQLYLAQNDVIGSMLIDPSIVGEVIAEVNPADFTDPTCRKIFDTCRDIYFKRQSVDSVEVFAALGETFERRTIYEIMQVTPTSANWRRYAEIMKEQAAVLRASELAGELMIAVSLEDVSRTVDKLNAQLCDRPGVKIVSFSEGLSDFYRRHDGAKRPEYLRWGFESLNKMLTAEAGDFIILGGYPSAGKTVMAIEFAWEMASYQNKRVGMFSLETKDEKLYDRLICRVAGIPFDEIKHNTISSESWTAVRDIAHYCDTVHLDVIRAAGLTASDIRAISLSRHYDIVFIDYLQLISTESRHKGNRTEAVAEISMALHTFAQTSDITIVALSQLTRPDKTDKSKAPTMSSLRESGQLEQDADIVMLLYLIDEANPNGPRRLKVAKNKEGERGYVDMGFNPAKMSFAQLSKRTDEPKPRSRFTEDTPDVEQAPLPEFFTRGGST